MRFKRERRVRPGHLASQTAENSEIVR